ncbi:MAG: glycine cleavage system aminomethyltransferase GcvT [Nitrospinota bacterium]|nr:glycine cleavage system aminomethyltransferase GcvT [Nitrospinota bacterium]
MSPTTLLKTPLFRKHVAAGAKMTDFHGWSLPLQYMSMMDECKAVRKSAGLFDICHMGKVEVKGKNAFRLLQHISTNDLSRISEGQAQYTALIDDQGGIIDDLVIYQISRFRFFLCLNAANTEKDISWIAEFALQYPDVEVRNLTRQYGLLSVQGPNSEVLIKSLAGARAAGMEYFHFMITNMAEKNVILSRTGYTGEDGFEIYCDWRDTDILWDALMAKGKHWSLKPCGLGARDLLRLEMGYLLHGVDMDASVTPYEVGLEWIVKLDKEGGLVAQEALTRKKTEGAARKIAGFEMNERGGLPRHGYSILAEGRIVGEVTSGGMSPCSGKTIGLGYILAEHSKPGTPIQIDIRGKAVEATVVRRPFLPSKTKKAKPAPAVSANGGEAAAKEE